MTSSKILGAAGRFGVRYGQRVKRRIAEIESRQRKKQACPMCGGTAKRLSKGIWLCKKCGKKFAGHAYYLETQTAEQRTPEFTTMTPVALNEKNLKKEKLANSEEKKSTVKTKSKEQ